VANQDYQTVWTAYQEAIARLYERPITAIAERGEGDIAQVTDLDARAQAVVERSVELGQVTAQGLELPDPNQRELSQLQLLAAATFDLAIANDLVRRAGEDVPDDVIERGPTLPRALVELQSILNTLPEAGILALLQVERAIGPSTAPAAKQALQDGASGALIDIRDDAARAGQAALSGLLELPIPPLKNAATVLIDELMVDLGAQVSVLLSKAAQLIVNAIDKLWNALGKQAQDEARQQAVQWIDDLRSGTLFGKLLDKLYELELIKQEIGQQINSAPDTLKADDFNAASQQMSTLAEKFRKQKEVLIWLIRGLALTRIWILGMQPWGPIALTTAYVVAIGYIVYAGGDYVDWFRMGTTQYLDFVPGVRSIIRQALDVKKGTDHGEDQGKE
jgi:hypothetical protein